MLRTLSARAERWPLRAPFRISRGVKTAADVVAVELVQGGQRGRGEGVPYARYGETSESVLAQIAGVSAQVEKGLTRAGLVGVLPPGAARNALDCALWDLEARLAGRSVAEIMAAIIEGVRPVDGTQDAETSRDALEGALSSELLDQFPNADLLALTESERLFVVERYTALDIFNNLALNIGKALQEKAPSISAGLIRLRELKNYVKQTVAAQFRNVRKAGQTLSPRTVAGIVRQTIQQTFDVFGGGEE